MRTDEFQPVAEELIWWDSIQQTEEERLRPVSTLDFLFIRRREAGFLCYCYARQFCLLFFFFGMGLFRGWEMSESLRPVKFARIEKFRPNKLCV